MNISTLQLAIHSSPRFSTWIWIPDWKVLIDAGDGATQQLGYKIARSTPWCARIRTATTSAVCCRSSTSAAKRGRLPWRIRAAARRFASLKRFPTSSIPGSSWQAVWHALEEGDELPGESGDRIIKAFRTHHYIDDDPQNPPRSLGFHLLWRKQKVKAELRELPQANSMPCVYNTGAKASPKRSMKSGSPSAATARL
jgi:hypothetical protein